MHGGHGGGDRRWLTLALALIAGFMAIEGAVGVLAGSLALLADAAHMLTDAGAIALALVAALMVRSGVGLVRDSGRIFLEAAPSGIDPTSLGGDLAAVPGVVEVHDLHVWQVTSGYPALSAHVLVSPGGDCHAVRRDIEVRLRDGYAIDHTTLQVDHAEPLEDDPHCADPHGAHYRAS